MKVEADYVLGHFYCAGQTDVGQLWLLFGNGDLDEMGQAAWRPSNRDRELDLLCSWGMTTEEVLRCCQSEQAIQLGSGSRPWSTLGCRPLDSFGKNLANTH